MFTQNGQTLRRTRKAAADQQWFELAGSVAANRVITGLFGVEPPLELNSTGAASSFLRDASVSGLPCNFRREGGPSLVIGGSSLVVLEGKARSPLQPLSSQASASLVTSLVVLEGREGNPL